MGDAPGARADWTRALGCGLPSACPRDLDELWAEPRLALAAGDLRAAAEACRTALALLPDEDDS